jgi:hypothetical protein
MDHTAVGSAQPATVTRLRGRRLLIARMAWLGVTALTLGLVILGFIAGFDRPELLGTPGVEALVARLGLPMQTVMAAALLVPMAAVATIAIFLFWRRSDDWMVLLFSVWILTNFAFTTRSLAALQQAYPAVQAPVRLIWLLAFILTIVLFYIFPDGRFVPRWTQLLVAVAVVLVVLSPSLPEDMLNLPNTPQGISVFRWRATILAWLGLWCTGMLAQVYRYRRVSGPVERQQAKWVMFTLSLFMAIIGLGLVIPSLFWNLPDVWFGAVLLTAAPLGIVLPVSIAMAILRYRLYDIDRVISRTVAYAMLTVLLGSVYAGVVLILGQLSGGIGAKPPTWAVASATLAVAALFQPARRRVQAAVDRRFNRRHYDAARTVEVFTDRLRQEVDLETLSAELLSVVDTTMQPVTVSLWLRPSAPGSSGTPHSEARPTTWAY